MYKLKDAIQFAQQLSDKASRNNPIHLKKSPSDIPLNDLTYQQCRIVADSGNADIADWRVVVDLHLKNLRGSFAMTINGEDILV
ncbi:hypothetical protein BH09BAC4_BH09BAC4_31460 [soil metagenome]